MTNLMKKAMNLTEKNIVRKVRTTSTNHRIVEILKGGKILTRIELVNEVTILRLLEKYSEQELDQKLTKLTEDFLLEFNKISRTSKNGVDTSLAEGQTNANFSYNPEFNTDWKIIKIGGNIKLQSKK